MTPPVFIGNLQRGLVPEPRAERVNNFDSIRFLGALSVLVSHAFPLTYGADSLQPLQAFSHGQIELGSMAVLVFFVISGFLITRSYDRRPDPVRFLEARVLRIFPGLLVALVFAVLLGAAVTNLPLGEYLSRPDTLRYVPRGLSLSKMRYDLPGVFPDNPLPSVINGSLWTLFYEFIMYLAVLGLGFWRCLGKGPMAVLLATAVVAAAGGLQTPYGPFACSFLGGATLYRWRESIPMDARLAAASLLVMVATLATDGFRLLFPVFGAYLVIYVAVSPAVRLPNFARWGDMSYGIYVFAFPVQQTVAMLLGRAGTWYWNAALSLPVVAALAMASWWLVEKPALDLKRSATRLPAGLPQPAEMRGTAAP